MSPLTLAIFNLAYVALAYPAGVAHTSREQAAKNWREFSADPEWKKVAAASEVNGKILVKPPESVFMDPADFSKLK